MVCGLLGSGARPSLRVSEIQRVSEISMTTIHKTGYLGFGSFFTEPVETIVAKASQADFTPESLIDTKDLLIGIDNTHLLGKQAQHLFMIDFSAWTFLNHGAFGGVCVPAFKEAERWRERCERQPLTFLDRYGTNGLHSDTVICSPVAGSQHFHFPPP